MLVDLFVDIMVAASLKLLCGMDLFETYLLFGYNKLIYLVLCLKLICYLNVMNLFAIFHLNVLNLFIWFC